MVTVLNKPFAVPIRSPAYSRLRRVKAGTLSIRSHAYSRLRRVKAGTLSIRSHAYSRLRRVKAGTLSREGMPLGRVSTTDATYLYGRGRSCKAVQRIGRAPGGITRTVAEK
jgi:predicted CopG family antitoxin